MSVAPISSMSSLLAGQAADLARTVRTKATAGSFDAKRLGEAAPAEQRAAVAAQFEAVLVRQMLGPTMTSMLGGTEGSVAGSVYGDMLADTLSQQLTAGRGMGLGRFIEQQLAPRAERAAHANSQ